MFELSNIWMIAAKQIERQNRAQPTKRRASDVIQRRSEVALGGKKSPAVMLRESRQVDLKRDGITPAISVDI
jgi:hypothetical protein